MRSGVGVIRLPALQVIKHRHNKTDLSPFISLYRDTQKPSRIPLPTRYKKLALAPLSFIKTSLTGQINQVIKLVPRHSGRPIFYADADACTFANGTFI